MIPRSIISDNKGRIYDHPYLAAAGMKAGSISVLRADELIKIPAGTRLFMMPARQAIAADPKTGEFMQVPGFAVAAFLPPGYTTTYNPAYREIDCPKPLPLFSYTACAIFKQGIYAAAIRVDRDRRHDSTRINIGLVKKGITRFKRIFPKNRLIPHLEKCALNYGCCGAQNFFLGEYEGPLPASPSCNSNCAGCISYQSRRLFPETQPRIKFTPKPEEIAEIAVFHIKNSGDPVVSFGQGCEGEPLMAGDIIEKSIRLIREQTSKGTINMNTNASKPSLVARLSEAGLDSMRVSMNSAQKLYYTRYYKPRSYSFEDVERSIKIMKRGGKFVSINYLTMPGFTDSPKEFEALKKLISAYHINMIQWRNLNYDPLLYIKELGFRSCGNSIGIRQEMSVLKLKFPKLLMGYFNPKLT